MRTPDIGIIGGLGPRASAEFVKTIYDLARCDREQQMPFVLLSSDPTFPDRTESLLRGNEQDLVKRLESSLEWFTRMNTPMVVMCCVTIHHLLPRLPRRLSERVTSLVSTALESVIAARTPALMLCSSGARALEIYERDDNWSAAQRWIVMPSTEDQDEVHRLLYRIKINEPLAPVARRVSQLLARYGVSTFIAGCTELHVLAREAERFGMHNRNWHCIDPLTQIAKAVSAGSESVTCNV